jgi:hypothetical protein
MSFLELKLSEVFITLTKQILNSVRYLLNCFKYNFNLILQGNHFCFIE